MNKFFLTFLIFAAAVSILPAQTSLSLSNAVYYSSGDTVFMPVRTADFSPVGAISLGIKYDTSNVHFNGIQKKFTQGVLLSSQEDNGEIKISWFDLNPLKLPDDTLFTLVFLDPRGNSGVQFDSSICEIADTSGSVLKVTYNNGSVTQKILPVSLAGRVWFDKNVNGVMDSGENGVQWVTVNLFKADGTWLTWQLTDSLGYYDFKDYKESDTSNAINLTPGSYYVSFILVDNNKIYSFGSEGTGSNPQINSHAKIVTDTTANTGDITLVSGENYKFANAGLILKNTTSVNGSLANQNKNSIPKEFGLQQNYPNPFNPTTTIQFEVPKTEMLRLNIYNILGQRIATLIDGEISAGIHTVTFNASNLNSGIYIYHLSGKGVSITKKMILTK